MGYVNGTQEPMKEFLKAKLEHTEQLNQRNISL